MNSRTKFAPMKRPLALIFWMTVSVLVCIAEGMAQETVEIHVALSPFTASSQRTSLMPLLQRFVLADCPNGARVVISDAYNLRVIADARLPRLNYDSPAARSPRAAPALLALQQWFRALDGAVIPTGLKDSGAIKFPEWVRSVATQSASGHHRALVVLASPIFLSEREPTFSMVGPNAEPRFPSDGHLTRTLAETPYAVPRGLLAGIAVNWGYPDEGIWRSDNHRYLVGRWWRLWTKSAGGQLANFSSDPAQALLKSTQEHQRASDDVTADTSDSALQMHVATERQIPVQPPPNTPMLLPATTTKPSASTPPEPIRQPTVAPQATSTPPPTIAGVESTAKPSHAVEPALLSRPDLASPVPPKRITLDVGVTDAAGTPIGGLSRNDFSISEDGVPQEINSFGSERAPVSVVVLLDASASIAPKLGKIRATASSIIRHAVDQDEFCVASFTTSVRILQDFTTDQASTDRALRTIRSGGGTALLDALKVAIEHATQHGKHERKAIVLITDGGEFDSQTTRAGVVPLLQNGNVQFFAVGLPEGLGQVQSHDPRGRGTVKTAPPEALARDLLDTLASASSGGMVFYPHHEIELGRIADSIISKLRAPRYAISYLPVRPQTETGWRSIRVTVNPSPGRAPLTARTRAGYVAGESAQ